MKRYIKSLEQETQHDGNIGIWWYWDGKVVGEYCPLSEGVEDRGYLQFSKTKNHITEWESVIKEQLPEMIDTLPKGYRSIERGRVVYNPRAMVYEIICSATIASDKQAIEEIANEFNISDLRYDVIPSSHYYVPTLTGNPTLDNFDFGD